MDPLLDVEPPPDGQGWWPDRFLVHNGWTDALDTTWRAVPNYPTMRARRDGNTLQLRTDGPAHSYQLTPTDETTADLAERD